jgi:2-succinyl-5-enolpyruvyl-6-hydroxy-3-cyclohexene-1-carboxylate synthase
VSVPSEGGDLPPSPADVQVTRCATLVDEWVRAGVRHAVVCPGSRSTPLVLALAADGRVTIHVRLDERSAGFVALGIGLATARPAVVCVTSGTAAAELHPAVVEAHHARVPLLLGTADRPPELHDVGAPQTIDQTDLYGRALRWRVDLGPAQWEERGAWRSLGSRAVLEATAAPAGPGPVQVNLPAREPLVGTAAPLPPGRAAGSPWHQVAPGPGGSAPRWGRATPPGPDGAAPAPEWWRRRGIILAGAGSGDPAAVLRLADALGWPVVADPRSGCRLARPGVVAAADALLRDGEFAARARPDVVVRLGEPWVSKVVGAWIEEATVAGATQVVVDPHGWWPDPGRSAHVLVRADPSGWCRAVADEVAGPTVAADGDGGGRSAPSPLRSLWADAEAAAQAAIDDWMGANPGATEPGVARSLVRLLAGPAVPAATLVVSSSMPVRDVECYAAPAPVPPRVLANRGASGIDGVVSTAVGVAVGEGRSVALVGDLAFLHDLTALVRPAGFAATCVVVVVDNGGGGIFSFLPVAGALDADGFDRLFAAPQDVAVADAARGLGAKVDEVDDLSGLERAVSAGLRRPGLSVVRAVVGDRATNVAQHGELDAAVVARLRALSLV